MHETKVVEEIETHFMFDNPFPKIVPFVRQCAKYGRTGQATNGSIIRRTGSACCVTTATNTRRICTAYCFSQQELLRERASVL
jgi:hypothetical protein